jgi:hypothetical protein
MHQSARIEFERVAREFARWRAVPEEERSPAPACWWGVAIALITDNELMPRGWCAFMKLPPSSTFGEAAAKLMDSMVDQTTWSSGNQCPRLAAAGESVAE